MTIPERRIDGFRRRLATLLTLKHTLTLVAGWAFVWGTVVLVLRATAGTPREPLLWGLAPVPAALAGAVWLARRQMPPRSAVRALLDQHNGCGGVLMAGEERELGAWEERLAEPQVPGLRWRGQRVGVAFAAGVAFAVAAFLVPDRTIAGPGGKLEVGREVAKLTQQVKVLEEEKFLKTEEALNLQKKLDQLRDESSARDPARTLETLDRVADVAKEKAGEAAEESLRKTAKLAEAEAVAEMLRKKQKPGDQGLSDKARAEAMQELARLMREAMKNNDKLGQIDPDQLDRNLDAEALKKLADALRDAKGDIANALENLKNAGLIDLDKLKECEACGKCDAEGLAKFLKECEGKCSAREGIARFCNGQRPGRGGVTRGRADAELTFGDPSPEEKARYKEQALPPAALDQLKESKLKGLGRGVPKVENGGGEAGALGNAAAGGGSANTQIILPRHKGAVERYFDRPAPK